jgi:hypothetical protein
MVNNGASLFCELDLPQRLGCIHLCRNGDRVSTRAGEEMGVYQFRFEHPVRSDADPIRNLHAILPHLKLVAGGDNVYRNLPASMGCEDFAFMVAVLGSDLPGEWAAGRSAAACVGV